MEREVEVEKEVEKEEGVDAVEAEKEKIKEIYAQSRADITKLSKLSDGIIYPSTTTEVVRFLNKHADGNIPHNNEMIV
jgi:hypothetical protein